MPKQYVQPDLTTLITDPFAGVYTCTYQLEGADRTAHLWILASSEARAKDFLRDHTGGKALKIHHLEGRPGYPEHLLHQTIGELDD